eukprot:CAMPEP_0174714862 /NCGR_PEP_ID=MMETSP1094-20130205/19648_1 /TAXON_ID=156173 /ORGANISM="Chrysochromulina brevifilum, Strain UTEX LB 985" /LENGTH=73 /DNA_ID=CAMNT_0015914317 /DNA_START=123 /DNA_END=344 /DNA_ORIENTATION=+
MKLSYIDKLKGPSPGFRGREAAKKKRDAVAQAAVDAEARKVAKEAAEKAEAAAQEASEAAAAAAAAANAEAPE